MLDGMEMLTAIAVTKNAFTYATMESSYSYDGSTIRPSSPTSFVMSKTARIETTVIQIDEVAMYLPGHILEHRLSLRQAGKTERNTVVRSRKQLLGL